MLFRFVVVVLLFALVPQLLPAQNDPAGITTRVDSLIIVSNSPGFFCSPDCGDGVTSLDASGRIRHWRGMFTRRTLMPEIDSTAIGVPELLWAEILRRGLREAFTGSCGPDGLHYMYFGMTFYLPSEQVVLGAYNKCGMRISDTLDQAPIRQRAILQIGQILDSLSDGRLPWQSRNP